MSMSIKYKIDDAKKNKNLINDEIKLSRIKSKGGNGDGGRKAPKSEAPAWFADFRSEVMQQFDRLENRIDTVVKVNNLKE